MLTISTPMKGGSTGNYYLELAREDYYTKAHEEPGRWLGTGAQQQGLHGTVSARSFKNLLAGYSADGQRALVQNAGDARRQKAWDLTFSAPKSVSVLWAMAPEDRRSAIERCHAEAVATTLAHVEEKAGVTRRGPGGRIKEKAGLIFATFRHSTSRAQDPQLHTHALLINVGQRQDDTTGALQTLDVFRLKLSAGAMYRRELAVRLEQRLELTLEPEAVGFHIRGVPQGLCEVFSKRGRAIKKALELRGESGAVAAKIVALVTRMRKQLTPRAELFSAWQAVGETYGWSTAEARQLLTPEQERQPVEARVSCPETRAQAPEARLAQAPTGQEADPERPRPEADQGDRHKSSPEPNQTKSRAGQKQAEAQSAGDQPTPNQLDGVEENARRSRQTGQDSRRRGPDCGQRPAGAHTKAAADTHANDHERDQSQRNWRDPLDMPFFRMGSRKLFPQAPAWSPASRLKVPVVTVGRPPRPRWGKVRWRTDLVFCQFRVQERRLFRRAPKWNPLHKLSVPTFRVMPVPQISKDQPARLWGAVLWQKELGPLVLRVQKRRLLPRAVHAAKASHLAVPALRLVRKEAQPEQSH